MTLAMKRTKPKKGPGLDPFFTSTMAICASCYCGDSDLFKESSEYLLSTLFPKTMNPVSETVAIGEHHLRLHRWQKEAEPLAVIVVYHGFLAHGRYPTVKYAAQLLAEAGYLVVSFDLPGHGESPGERGLLPSVDELIRIGKDVSDYAMSLTTGEKKLFLLGSSLGGAIALAVALQMNNQVDGVCMLAPMLGLSISQPVRLLLQGIASISSSWEMIPSSATSAESQYRDATKRAECENDEFVVKKKYIRVGSASTCVNLVEYVKERFSQVECPFLIMVADQDVVVDNQGALDLYEHCHSTKRTFKRYSALHGTYSRYV